MAGPKTRNIWQYGDFQTPPALALEVCAVLARRGIDAPAVMEPTCGRGAFIKAVSETFPRAQKIFGVEINSAYVADARKTLESSATRSVHVEHGDFFATDWDKMLDCNDGAWLIIGNPPWVTNAELETLKSENLPTKSNFQGHRGLDAITGKANFDISEWMLLQNVAWLERRSGWIAMLAKTSVARKVLRQVWKRGCQVGRAAIYKIDAKHHFGAAVDACLFVLPVNVGEDSRDCDVYAGLSALAPVGTIGLHDDLLVADVTAYMLHRHLIGPNEDYIWRSGVKHDCSKVIELSNVAHGKMVNGWGNEICIEEYYLYPMLKSSDLANGRVQTSRFMIVTQQSVGESTSDINLFAPKTWQYLLDNGGSLDARGSVIYRNKPRFSVFGVGGYTFAPWKVAVSGFYKDIKFVKVGPQAGRPTVFDDTIYFLPCRSEAESDFLMILVNSYPFRNLLRAMVFRDEKRPVTAELLRRISLEKLAGELGLANDYRRFVQRKPAAQLDLELASQG